MKLANPGLVLQIPPMSNRKIHDLVQVYRDLESTLKHLKRNAERSLAMDSSPQINVRKLISRLSRSKKKLERKIGNTLLLEKQHFKRRLRAIASNLGQKTSD